MQTKTTPDEDIILSTLAPPLPPARLLGAARPHYPGIIITRGGADNGGGFRPWESNRIEEEAAARALEPRRGRGEVLGRGGLGLRGRHPQAQAHHGSRRISMYLHVSFRTIIQYLRGDIPSYDRIYLREPVPEPEPEPGPVRVPVPVPRPVRRGYPPILWGITRRYNVPGV